MAPKKKQEKMALGDFLTNQSLGSWADEMDSQPIPSASSNTYSARDRAGGEERRGFGQSSWERSASGVGGSGGGGGGSSYERQGYAVREALPFPDKPPYTAHLGNLAFDVSQADVEGFLAGCEVTSVRIVEDKLDRKPKGFGYVEFGTLDGLKKALTLTDSPLMGRNVRISIAEPPKERAESTRDFSDWSRKGPLPDIASQGRQPSRGFSRGNFDAASDAGSERGGSRRPGYFQEDNKQRDFGNWERKGPLTPAPGAGPPAREGNGEPRGERRLSPAWGEGTGRNEAGSRPPRREFQERPPVERAPTAAEQDSQWRTKMRPDAPSPAATPEASAPTSPAAQAPKERPRLNLTKRTVSTAEPDSNAASSDAKASPFGAARPADTAQRDREIAEKREIAIREKKEADDKIKEEKTAKEAAARQARAERADRGQTQQDEKVTSPTSENAPKRPARQQPPARNPWTKHQNGEEFPQKERPTFNVLKHDAEGGDEQPEDVPDAPANGTIVGDKDTKPQEITREVPRDAGEGAVQNTEPTAEAMEDDGWSTVASKPKNQPKNNNRRGGARALAS